MKNLILIMSLLAGLNLFASNNIFETRTKLSTIDLFMAIENQDSETIKNCITSGVDLNTPSPSNYLGIRLLPIESAIIMGNKEYIDLLENSGARPNSNTEENIKKIINQLSNTIDTFENLFKYAQSQITKTNQVHEVPQKVLSEESRLFFLSFLEYCITTNKFDDIKKLIDNAKNKNSDINMTTLNVATNNMVESSLKCAIKNNSKETIHMLIEAGANFNTSISLSNEEEITEEKLITQEILTGKNKLATIRKNFDYFVSKI